ncbi:MAG: response regulator [Syntrophothermus sp.]
MHKRILLVDDESSLRRSLSLSLNQHGYDVEPCDNGITALNKIDQYQKSDVMLDTVVLDINLPDIDGLKLGRIIHAKYPDLKMMYITGYADKIEQTEIDDIQNAGLLEKPFTADDLIHEINRILEKQKPHKEEAKTTAAYCLIKSKRQEDFVELYRRLYFMDNVLYCDAVRGDLDIFLLIQADSEDECLEFYDTRIKGMDGIAESVCMPVEVPVLNDAIRDILQSAGISMLEENPEKAVMRDSSKAVFSYVLLEIDREKLDRIYTVINLTDNVLYCDYTSGRYNLVLLIYGPQFSEIDRVIENKIINLDGVLKVKRYPVISLFEI